MLSRNSRILTSLLVRLECHTSNTFSTAVQPLSTLEEKRSLLKKKLWYKSQQHDFVHYEFLMGLWAKKNIPRLDPSMFPYFEELLDDNNPDFFKYLAGHLEAPPKYHENPIYTALREDVLRRTTAAAPRAGDLTAVELDEAARNAVGGELLLAHDSSQLDASDVGGYYHLNISLVPEALKPFHQSFYAPRGPNEMRNGGVRTYQKETEITKRDCIMFRKCFHDVMSALTAPDGPRQIFLEGQQGCGKSYVMLALAEWGRNNGWVVVFLPSASQLTEGGYFVKRHDADLYDTIISAQHLLKSVVDAHGPALAKIPASAAAADVLQRAELRKKAAERTLSTEPEDEQTASETEPESSRSEEEAATSASVSSKSEVTTGPASTVSDADGKSEPTVAAAVPAANTESSSSSSSTTEDSAAVAGAADAAESSSDESSSSSDDSSSSSDEEPSAEGGGMSLLDFAKEGLATDDDGQLAVECALALMSDLLAAGRAGRERVLVLLDDYNYLYWFTDYGQTVDRIHRRNLKVEELPMALGMRLLANTGLAGNQAAIVGSRGQGIGQVPPRLSIPLAPTVAAYHVPRFNLVETAHILAYYADCGWAPHTPTPLQVKKMHLLTAGNGREILKFAPKMSLLDSPLVRPLF